MKAEQLNIKTSSMHEEVIPPTVTTTVLNITQGPLRIQSPVSITVLTSQPDTSKASNNLFCQSLSTKPGHILRCVPSLTVVRSTESADGAGSSSKQSQICTDSEAVSYITPSSLSTSSGEMIFVRNEYCKDMAGVHVTGSQMPCAETYSATKIDLGVGGDQTKDSHSTSDEPASEIFFIKQACTADSGSKTFDNLSSASNQYVTTVARNDPSVDTYKDENHKKELKSDEGTSVSDNLGCTIPEHFGNTSSSCCKPVESPIQDGKPCMTTDTISSALNSNLNDKCEDYNTNTSGTASWSETSQIPCFSESQLSTCSNSTQSSSVTFSVAGGKTVIKDVPRSITVRSKKGRQVVVRTIGEVSKHKKRVHKVTKNKGEQNLTYFKSLEPKSLKLQSLKQATVHLSNSPAGKPTSTCIKPNCDKTSDTENRSDATDKDISFQSEKHDISSTSPSRVSEKGAASVINKETFSEPDGKEIGMKASELKGAGVSPVADDINTLNDIPKTDEKRHQNQDIAGNSTSSSCVSSQACPDSFSTPKKLTYTCTSEAGAGDILKNTRASMIHLSTPEKLIPSVMQQLQSLSGPHISPLKTHVFITPKKYKTISPKKDGLSALNPSSKICISPSRRKTPKKKIEVASRFLLPKVRNFIYISPVKKAVQILNKKTLQPSGKRALLPQLNKSSTEQDNKKKIAPELPLPRKSEHKAKETSGKNL